MNPQISIQDILGPTFSSKLNIANNEMFRNNIQKLAADDTSKQQISPPYETKTDSLQARYESIIKSRISTFGAP